MSNQYYAPYYTTGNQRVTNKVYINPNYNKPVHDNRNYNSMYLNPNFSHVMPNTVSFQYQQPEPVRPKIYVNPNFIHPSTTMGQVNRSCIDSTPSIYSQAVPAPVQTQVVPPPHVTKSRYSLVRPKENQVSTTIPKPETIPTKVITNTVRVHKYKLVSMNSVKKKLAVEQRPEKIVTATIPINTLNNKEIRLNPTSTQATRFKFVKDHTANIARSSSKYQVPNILNKSINNRSKKVISVLKKNNIPCPLFKKYGMCLRKIQGSCEYLHDKKHVSICRKFIKGLCLDKNCLLSHDLTDKKMPTCYFYLQGACNSENCPYLHVKVNEKAKICPEFLKGYCEKGDQCLYRHVCPKKIAKVVKTNNITPQITIKKDKKRMSLKIRMRRKSLVQNETNSKKEEKKCKSVGDQRYFIESVDDNTESCDLKPTRCKLGNLPSFIHL